MECLFCKKILSSKYHLKYHQKTTKSCIALQNGAVTTKLHECDYCKKTFTALHNLEYHAHVCKKRPGFISKNVKLEHSMEDLKRLMQYIRQLEDTITSQKKYMDTELQQQRKYIDTELQHQKKNNNMELQQQKKYMDTELQQYKTNMNRMELKVDIIHSQMKEYREEQDYEIKTIKEEIAIQEERTGQMEKAYQRMKHNHRTSMRK